MSNTLGVGFLEKVYENALAHELRLAGLEVEQQKTIAVNYRDIVVGSYTADLLVADCVLVELKVAKALDATHVAQCLNYLKGDRTQSLPSSELWSAQDRDEASGE